MYGFDEYFKSLLDKGFIKLIFEKKNHSVLSVCVTPKEINIPLRTLNYSTLYI